MSRATPSAGLATPAAASAPPLWRLAALSLAEWRHHPWRHAAALLAVALGVALAASVQTLNASALGEFGQAVRAVNGEPDLSLAATQRDGLGDALYAALAQAPSVAVASPVLELDLPAHAGAEPPQAGGPAPQAATQAAPEAASHATSQATSQAASHPTPPSESRPEDTLRRPLLRVLGVDLLSVGQVAPALLPAPEPGQGAASSPGRGALAWLSPQRVYLNPAARQLLQARPGDPLWLNGQAGWQRFEVAGAVAAAGPPLAVVDIAAAQTRLGAPGRLSRVDLRLHPGTDAEAWSHGEALAALGGRLPAAARWSRPDDAQAKVSNLSRAYRVNLGVLALVALLVGGFLVYSVVSLSVAQRTPQLALLGVLGLGAAERRRLVLAESAVVGLVGSVLGLAAGAALALLALRLLGADLGGGYFAGVAPQAHWPLGALAACGALGVAATVLGAWWPARQAERLRPAQALKGLGGGAVEAARAGPGLLLMAAGGGLALAPPVGGLPLAAYAAVALWLAGGVALVPALVRLALAAPLPTRLRQHHPLLLLAWRRAHFARGQAAATVAGVVASLALAVAITVMVASFRDAVADWLDHVLPADLYVRTAGGAGQPLPPGLAASAAALPGVQRVEPGRVRLLALDPRQPALTLLARPLSEAGATPQGGPASVSVSVSASAPAPTTPGDAEAAARLPLLAPPWRGARLHGADGRPLPAAWVSEPAAALYGWQPGQRLALPLAEAPGGVLHLQVMGLWRDYARQFGAVLVDLADYRRLTGDTQHTDLALWLRPGQPAPAVEAALQAAVAGRSAIDTVGTQALRQLSLRIFDRSFAVTHYLQAVAIAVGLAGVVASLSAQVLARRKEFGLLVHLGLARREITRLVVAEAGVWLLLGTALGVGLGLLLAVVLVHVVNPQSFHWSMPLRLPPARLAALAGAVLASGLLAAWWSARQAVDPADAVRAVKEDW